MLHLPVTDSEAGPHFEVHRVRRGAAAVHQPATAAIAVRPSIKIDSLDERTGTVAHPDDGDSDFAHSVSATLCAGRFSAQVTSFRFSMVRPSLRRAFRWPENVDPGAESRRSGGNFVEKVRRPEEIRRIMS